MPPILPAAPRLAELCEIRSQAAQATIDYLREYGNALKAHAARVADLANVLATHDGQVGEPRGRRLLEFAAFLTSVEHEVSFREDSIVSRGSSSSEVRLPVLVENRELRAVLRQTKKLSASVSDHGGPRRMLTPHEELGAALIDILSRAVPSSLTGLRSGLHTVLARRRWHQWRAAEAVPAILVYLVVREDDEGGSLEGRLSEAGVLGGVHLAPSERVWVMIDLRHAVRRAVERLHMEPVGLLGLALTVAILAAFLWLGRSLPPSPVPPPTASAREMTPAMVAFGTLLTHGDWIAYEPTNYDPFANEPVFPSDESILADLTQLRAFGFNGIITFRVEGIPHVARLAKKLGMAVIQGVDLEPPSTRRPIRADVAGAVRREVDSAVELRDVVDAYCVGHTPRDPEQVLGFVDEVRRQTGKPVTTTTYLDDYEKYLDRVDWLFPDVAVRWRIPDPPATEATELAWFERRFDELKNLAQRVNKPALLKTVSFPSEGADRLTEASQDAFFRGVLARYRQNNTFRDAFVGVSYFLAFDSGFKRPQGPSEPFTGLFRLGQNGDRELKPAACQFLTISPENRFGWAAGQPAALDSSKPEFEAVRKRCGIAVGQ